jgi:hypothetical protein
MKFRDLTGRAGPATSLSTKGPVSSVVKNTAVLSLVSAGLAGCITVNAPEEPIVIELNVNIRQEVIYRLAQDAGDTIEDNADIF